MSTDQGDSPKGTGGDTFESKDRPLHEEIEVSKRTLLATLGVGALGVGYAMGQASQLEGAHNDDLYAAGFTTSLTKLRSKDGYYSGPKSAFDPAELSSGELAIVPDDWGIAVKGQDGTMEVPSIGSSAQPVPSVTAEELKGIADQIVTTSDDLQTAVDNASGGDTLFLEGGTHTISSPVTIDKPLTIHGHLTVTGNQSVAPDTSIDAVGGSTIEQQTAGANCLTFTGVAEQLNLHNLHLTWRSALKDSDTGHGIECVPPSDGAGAKQNGLYNAEWSNITVTGHDGNHYGATITNLQQSEISKFKTYGGGGLEFIQDSNDTNFGNTVITDFYCKLRNDSSDAAQAHGIHEHAVERLLNLLLYLRPQVNTTLEAVTGQQHIKKTVETGGTIDELSYIAPNMESTNNNSSGIDMPPSGSHMFLPSRVEDYLLPSQYPLLQSAETNVDIRSNLIRAPEIEATNSIGMRDDADGSTASAITYDASNDRMKFTHSRATNAPEVRIYPNGLIGIIQNGGLIASFEASTVDFRGSRLVGPETTGSATDPRADTTPDDYMEVEKNGTVYYVPLYS